MAYYTKRGKYSWRLVIPRGYDARGKRRPPATKTIQIEDPALLQSIEKLNEYDPAILQSTKSLRDFVNNKDAPSTPLRHAKKLHQYFEEELMKFKISVESGNHKKNPGKIPFVEFVKFWDENYVSKLSHLSQINYRSHCETRIIPYFESSFLDEITTEDLVKFMTDLEDPNTKIGKRLDGKPGPLNSSTILYVYRVLFSIFAKAVQWKKLTENPMKGVDRPKVIELKKPRYYTEEELVDLFEAMEKEIQTGMERYKIFRIMFQVLITLALTTGMRRAELIGLRWSKIDLDRGKCEIFDTVPAYKNGEPVIKRPKNGEPRIISLSPSVVEMLREYKEVQKKYFRMLAGQENVVQINDKDETDHYLFVNFETGKPLHPQTIRKRWFEFHARNPHLKYIPFHGIRHTATSIMIAKHVHDQAIKNRLGWKNSKMIDRYGHIFKSVDEAAAEVFEEVLPPKKRKA